MAVVTTIALKEAKVTADPVFKGRRVLALWPRRDKVEAQPNVPRDEMS